MSGHPIPQSLRHKVRRRAHDRCEYCQYPQAACYAAFHVDHFAPASRHGKSDIANLVWACPACNGSKQAKTSGIDPASKTNAPLFNPRDQDWHAHFKWSADLQRIIGTTPTGRATVKLLRMNRRGAAVIRSMLVQLGQHPAQLERQ